MPTTVHFEIPADNVQRAKAFYEGLFGWPRTAVPGMGYFAICLDTENNAFGLWEEDAKAA